MFSAPNTPFRIIYRTYVIALFNASIQIPVPVPKAIKHQVNASVNQGLIKLAMIYTIVFFSFFELLTMN